MKKKSENFESIESAKKMEHKEYVNNVFDFSMEFKGEPVKKSL